MLCYSEYCRFYLIITIFILMILLLLFPLSGHSQIAVSDTVEEHPVVSDSLSDSDSVKFHIRKEVLKESHGFYDTIRNKASRNSILQSLYDLIFVQSREDDLLSDSTTIDEIVNPFDVFAGKMIDSIKFHQLDVFGASVDDTLFQDIAWYKEVGNWMHITTRKHILRDNILFSEGDNIDPLLIADSERLLRRLPYLKDARILIEEHPVEKNRVNVIVITQDVWSKGFNLDLSGLDAGEIDVYDNNIFGIGHKLQNDLIFDYFKTGNPGFRTLYRVDNIAGTFIDSRLTYMDAFDNKQYGLEASRDFFSYKTNWVGGLKAYKYETLKNIRKTDTILYNTPLDYIDHDFWLGYGLPVSSESRLFKNRNRIVLALRYKRSKFFEGPDIRERYNYPFHNHHIFLANLSFSRQNYYTSSLMYGFGRTEDIPVGDLFGYTFGWEIDEFFKRFYTGLNFRHGEFFSNFGYISNSLDFGGFIYKNNFEQGVFNFRSKYISKLFHVKNLKIRQFVDFNYKCGIERFDDEFITFNPSMDIRGFSRADLTGKQKLVMKFETVGFTNLFYYGFRFAFYGFADIGFIGRENKLIFENPMQHGFGIGMRVRNENLVFNTFQMRLGYYPNLSPTNNLLFRISGEKSFRPYEYNPSMPDMVEY
ncbi:MAG: hypothetical protein ACLFUW_04415 [Bacteroidales bacterium]